MDYFADRLNYGDDFEILDIASCGTTLYAACRHDGQVEALIICTRWDNRYNANYWYYCEWEREMPDKRRCPRRILAQLSPIEALYNGNIGAQECARSWREACLKRLGRLKTREKVKRGDVVLFARSFHFSGDGARDAFVFEGGSTFRIAYPDGSTSRGLYQIYHWRDHVYTVVDHFGC